MVSQSPQIDALNWEIDECGGHANVHEAIQKTNWTNLCQRASELNNGLICAPFSKRTNGMNNLVCILEFSDCTRWVARISLHSSAAASAKLRSEIAVMQLIKERCECPVPEIFAYETDSNNSVGVPYILMEFLPGNTAMDSAGGYEVHGGRIPQVHRQRFYRSVAKCHAQFTALRFPKIGTVFRNQKGEYDIGPFPNIGGPFDCATSFYRAWAAHAKFPLGTGLILEMMKGGPAERVLQSINEFPSRIMAAASWISSNDHGPFPLCHADFYHSNIVVDENFEVLGIIDWESACTLPLELVDFPCFLSTMPISFGSPDNYDENGQPIDRELKQRWEERKDYVQMIREVEHEDNLLSTCLTNVRNLALAYLMTSYRGGKLGFYDTVMDGV
ncbi:kinase-like domain-containing protein [Nemania sp. FL0916]|nr:kinase-like domain-containing protein [Nemania sp. FL0916]